MIKSQIFGLPQKIWTGTKFFATCKRTKHKSLPKIGPKLHFCFHLKNLIYHVLYDLFYFSVSLACGATTSENCTYLTLAATASVAGTACTYTICPASSTVSRIRLDLTVNFVFCLNSSISLTATKLGTQINILVNNPSIIQSRLLPTR